MIRTFICLALAIASYFAITKLVEHKIPDLPIANLGSLPPKNATKLHPNGVPDQLVGVFTLNVRPSKSWLHAQDGLDEESKAYVASLQSSQSKFTFDGKSIFFANHVTSIPVKLISVENQTAEFKMLESSVEHQGSLTFFLQWDNKGNVWYSNYSHLHDGEKQLYRACFTKVKPSE